MIDWLYKTGNFNSGHLTSALMVEGYYDNYNFSAEKLKTFPSYSQNRKDCMVQNGTKCRWEFSFTPSIGFLGNPDELLSRHLWLAILIFRLILTGRIGLRVSFDEYLLSGKNQPTGEKVGFLSKNRHFWGHFSQQLQVRFRWSLYLHWAYYLNFDLNLVSALYCH